MSELSTLTIPNKHSKSFKSLSMNSQDFLKKINQKHERKPSEEIPMLSPSRSPERNKKIDNGKIKDTSIAKIILKSGLSKVKRKIQIQLYEMKAKIEELDPFKGILSEDSLIKGEISDEDIGIESDKIYKEHMRHTFLSLKGIRGLKKISEEKLQEKMVNLPRRFENEGRKTVIFDLDETLVHCVGVAKGHVSLPVKFPNGKSSTAGVNIRPFAIECLEAASQLFEVIVFTASHKCYADVILDYLDPENKIIHHRLYREHCVQVNNFNIKDLRIINRRIQDIVIIDNAIVSFAFHLNNGVPIISWFKNPYDKELQNLISYFTVISEAEDVRDINRSLFHLDTFYEDYCDEFNNL